MNKLLSRGIVAVANLFAPAFGLIRAAPDGDVTATDAAHDAADAETPKRRGGYSGAKLERRAAKGRVGLATLR